MSRHYLCSFCCVSPSSHLYASGMCALLWAFHRLSHSPKAQHLYYFHVNVKILHSRLNIVYHLNCHEQVIPVYIQWLLFQVRFKALCLIETSIKQREENKVLDSVTAMFEEDASAVVDSLQSPQASLRDKAKKVNLTTFDMIQLFLIWIAL